MISVRLGCDIRSGPAGQKNDANANVSALARKKQTGSRLPRAPTPSSLARRYLPIVGKLSMN
jgi:hypothetical protein